MSKKLRKNIRVIISMVLVLAMLGGSCVFAGDDENGFQEQLQVLQERYAERIEKADFIELEKAYRMIAIEAETNGEYMLTSLDEFLERYDQSGVEEYIKLYPFKTEVKNNLSGLFETSYKDTRSGGSAWYYNTGTALPQAASYSMTDMLDVVIYGDIVVETDATTQGLLGHAAIVEGIFYSSTYHMYYIRLIESIETGVCRSVMDDSRYFDKGSGFYRIYGVTSTDRSTAVSFAIAQLGKSYRFPYGHNYSYYSTSWYCSELVWAAYYYGGTDILPSLSDSDIITPYMLAWSSYTYQLYITE